MTWSPPVYCPRQVFAREEVVVVVEDEEEMTYQIKMRDAAQDAHAVAVGPVVQDVPQPVDTRTLHRVLVEVVVGNKLDPSRGESIRALSGPYLYLGPLDSRRVVLQDKSQVRVELGWLEAEAAYNR